MASGEPPEKDMKEFEFVQLCKFRVSEPDFIPPAQERSQMLACSSIYGLIIYGSKSGFNVVKTADILSIDEATGTQRNKVTIEDIPVLAKVILPSPAHILSLSGDGKFLSVVYKEGGQINMVFFDVHGFTDKTTSPLPFGKLPLSISPGVSIADLAWNPTVFSMIAVCYSDGGLALFDVQDSPKVITSLPSAVGATCMSWSPKGKQLLVGKRNGTLSQYDHALTEKKQWPCPSVFAKPQAVVDVLWLSTYTFMAAYLPEGAQDSDQPVVVMTNSNKENNSTYINFEDVCFSSSEDRKPQYLFHNIQKWEVVLMASSRATEVTLVGKNLDNKTSWEHWNLEDSCRAELPLTGDQCDSFPLGLAVDYSPQKPVVLSEIKSLPACPVMFLLSSDGLLLAYHLHYFHREAGQITSPSQGLNPAQARKGIPGLLGKPTPTPAASVTQPLPPQQQAKPSLFPALSQSTTAAPSPSLFGPGTTSGGGGDAGKNVFNIFGASAPSGNNPAASSVPAPSFQFGKATDAAAAFSATTPTAVTSTTNQKPGLLSMPPSAAASATTTPQSQGQGQGQPIGSSFSFSLRSGGAGTAASKPGQSSAFASIPPSNQSAAPSSTATGFNFGQAAAGPSLFGGSSTPVTKPGSTTPFMAPRQATPPTQQATPPSGLAKAPHQSVTTTPEQQQQQRPAPSIFGVGAPIGSKAGTPLSINSTTSRPLAPPSGGVMGAHNVAVTKPVGGQQTAQVKGSPIPQRTPETGNISSIEATVDGAFSLNIAEEVAHFEEEMKKFRSRSKRDVKSVGTRPEMLSLRRDTEETVNYLSQIKDAVKDQLHEVQDMKSNCFNLSADVEKSSTQLQRNSDPHYHSLLQGKALDPASAKQLQDIQQIASVLEQTLSEINHSLDSQWEQHLADRSRQGRLSTPTGDAIYKSIKNNHQIICHQRRNVEKLEEKMSNLRLGSRRDRSSSSSVYSLVAEESPRASCKQEFSPGSRKPLSLKEAVSQGMTPEKVSKLKEILSSRKVPLVKPKTPATLSSSRIVSTPRRPPSSSSSPLKSTPTTTKVQQPPGLTPHQQLQQQLQQKALFGNVAPAASYQNTPSGIPSTELRLPKGPLPNPESVKPNSHTSIFGGSGPGGVQLGGGGGLGIPQPQAPQQLPPPPPSSMRMAGAPTSFSGVAYFKQPTPPPAVAATAALSPSHLLQQQQQQQQQQQKLSDVQAATQVLNKHLPAMFAATAQQPLPQQQQRQQQQQPLRQPEYEDITPTETDETYEDEDYDEEDYDDEDGGYEDEDEEEEEEDYADGDGGAGGFGVGQSFFPVKTAVVSVKGNGGDTATPSSTTGSAASASASGFSFGATSAAFGQKIPAVASASPSSTGATPVFGGPSLSRSVGFSDLVKGSGDGAKTSATSPSIFGGGVSGAGSTFAFNTAASPVSPGATTATSPGGVATSKATPTSPAAGFSFLSASAPGSGGSTAAASSSGGGGLFGGAGKTTTSPNSMGAEKQKPTSSLPAYDKPKSPPASPDSSQLGTPAPASNSGGGGGVKADSTSPTTQAPVKTLPVTQTGTNSGQGSITPEATTAAPALPFGGGSATTASTVSKSSPAPTGTAMPLFGGGGATVTSAAAPSSSSIFGSAAVSTNSASTPAATTTPGSLFGGTGGGSSSSTAASPFATPKSSSLFGNVSSSTSTPSLFGGGNATTSATTPSSLPSLFGAANNTSSSSSSIFGNAATGNTATAAPTSSIFGLSSSASSSAAATKPPLFGTPATSAPASDTPSVFGSLNATTASTAAANTATPVFGASQTSSSSTSSPFFGGGGGTPAATSASSSSIFGKSDGNGGSSTFSFNTQPSPGSAFGSGGGFGSNMAAPAASTASSSGFAFNQPTSTAAPGGSSGGASATSFFGGGFGGLGAKPSEEKANTNVFGSPQTFGSPTTQTSLFGNNSSSPFGGTTFGGDAGVPGSSGTTPGTFGSNTSSAGSGGVGGGVAAAGFGVSSTSAATSGGFGSSPAFGSAPSFGGGAPAFGAGAKPGGFGSPSSVFGGGATFGSAATFGSPTSTSAGGGGVFGSVAGPGNNAPLPGFGSFAAAPAPSFGQLASSSSTAFGNSGAPGGGGFGGAPGGGGFGGAPGGGAGGGVFGGAPGGGGGAQSSPFGGAGGGGGGGFGNPQVFGQSPSGGGGGFGSPQGAFGGNQNQPQGSGFGSSPAFSSYRG